MYRLKSCPFCGSYDVGLRYGLDGWKSNVFRPYRIAFVQCNNCHARTKRCRNYKLAIKAWNSRSTPIKELDKICPVNGAPCNECIPGAYCAKTNRGVENAE